MLVFVEHSLDWNFFLPVIEHVVHDTRFSVLIVLCTQLAAASAKPEIVSRMSLICVPEFGGLEDIPVEIMLSCGGGSRFHAHGKRVYLMHSPVSAHVIYPETVFDSLDFILCTGPHHIRELSASFRLRGIQRPILIPFGYPWIDSLMSMGDVTGCSHERSKRKPQILFAPSWGPQNALVLYGEKIIAQLVDNYRVCLRPHIRNVEDDKSILERLRNRFDGHPNFQLDLAGDSSYSLLTADLLISDWSGVAFEYALARLKPVLFVDSPMKVRNPNWQRVLGEHGIECTYRTRIGRIASSIDNIAREVEDLLLSSSTWKKRLLEARNQLLFHVGESAKRAPEIFYAIANNRILSDWVVTGTTK